MRQKQGVFSLFLLSPSSRRAWIEIKIRNCNWKYSQSPSSRRAWIEIDGLGWKLWPQQVALLAEGVDRNIRRIVCKHYTTVALLAEGVDRNYFAENWYREMPMSPSSRRAWIEIVFFSGSYIKVYVALLAEGVDRNKNVLQGNCHAQVALLAEGVDRNIFHSLGR